MQHKLISLILLFLSFSILLESCQTRPSALRQELSEASAIVKTKPSVNSLRVEALVGNYKTYENAEDLEIASGLIIIGKPQASLEESKPTSIPISQQLTKQPIVNESIVVKDNDGAIIDRYTISSVKVQKVVKGQFKEKEIRVIQPSAVVKEDNQAPFISTIEGYSPLKKNSKYILFLKEIDTATYPKMAGVYSILSVNQGKFNFDNTDTEETKVEASDNQYADLKAKVRAKYGAMVNALP